MAKRSKTVKNHIHRYKKVRYGRKGTLVARCMLPSCTHMLTGNIDELLIGRQSLCPRCSEPFIIEKRIARRLVYPHCDACTIRRDSMRLEDLIEDSSELDEVFEY